MSAKGYITRASIASGSIGQILLRNTRADGAHTLIWSLFEHREKGDRSFLYREESPCSFLIVSQDCPTDNTGVWQLESKPYAPELGEGERLAFILRCNPARTYKSAAGTRRTDAVIHAAKAGQTDRLTALNDWLAPRLEQVGAELLSLEELGWQVRRLSHGAGNRHNVGVADLSGTLSVRMPDSFTQTLFTGFGKAKAYGCGLLLVRRI